MDIKELYKSKGFAKGDYYNKCSVCGECFVGDKRAWTCFDCASDSISSDAVLGEVVKLLTEYTQYLYKFGYLDDDWIMEASSPIQEFINKKFGNVV